MRSRNIKCARSLTRSPYSTVWLLHTVCILYNIYHAMFTLSACGFESRPKRNMLIWLGAWWFERKAFAVTIVCRHHYHCKCIADNTTNCHHDTTAHQVWSKQLPLYGNFITFSAIFSRLRINIQIFHIFRGGSKVDFIFWYVTDKIWKNGN